MNKKENRTINNWERIRKIAISTYLSINPSNVNGLNTAIKRHKMAE